MAKIAIDAGFRYGAQLPHKVYYAPYFADQDWRKPNKRAYIDAVEFYRPHIASVLDWERQDQLGCVLEWAEDIAQYVQVVVIIPKVQGGVKQLPHSVGGKRVRLGYSVPTRYSGTELPVWEFAGWPVHLLGGSPHRQMELARYLDVRSVDGNMAMKLAVQHCQFWVGGNAQYASNRWWPTLKEAGGGIKWEGDNAHHEAFRRSCKNIRGSWDSL